MRKIDDHIVPGDDPANQLTITVMDEPGAGGANHEYGISHTYRKGDKVPLRGRLSDQVITISSDGSSEITLA